MRIDPMAMILRNPEMRQLTRVVFLVLNLPHWYFLVFHYLFKSFCFVRYEERQFQKRLEKSFNSSRSLQDPECSKTWHQQSL